MTPTREGSFRLFRLFRIDVYLHWSWIMVAGFQISTRQRNYTSPVWNVFEYLTLFVIVLLHEFGHSLACRQVGGRADQIVLWPFGGVAYVSPPQRPGAVLWSIAAGPLVNVVLAIIFIGVNASGIAGTWYQTSPNAYGFFQAVQVINFGLLVFNLLPIYPLDGGQILQSLLWFFVGQARSLLIATVLGFVGIAVVFALILFRSPGEFSRDLLWLALITLYIGANCWRGFQHARALIKISKYPRHAGYACPSCRQPPLDGAFWSCLACRNGFDPFTTQGVCPHCATVNTIAVCPECHVQTPLAAWKNPPSRSDLPSG